MKNNFYTTTPCKQCKYYYGKQAIHCSVHPRGKESEYCDDWQKETRVQKVATLVKSRTKRFSGEKAVSLLLGFAVTTGLVYGLVKTVVAGMDGYQRYEKYAQECGVFLERAGFAGVAGIAEEELTLAVSWLKTQNMTKTFEFKNLQGSLNYLRKQSSDSALPIVIRDSINKSAETIKANEIEKRNDQTGGLECLILLGLMLGITVVFMLLSVLNSY